MDPQTTWTKELNLQVNSNSNFVNQTPFYGFISI